MTRSIRAIGFVAMLVLFSAVAAKADSVAYTLTGPGFSDTFTATQNPSYTGSTSNEIIISVSGLNVDGQNISKLDLFSSSKGGGLGALLNFGYSSDEYQLDGPQLYSSKNGVVTLLTGTFTLQSGYTLKAVDPPSKTPEPATTMLLGMGLGSLGLLRKRRLSS